MFTTVYVYTQQDKQANMEIRVLIKFSPQRDTLCKWKATELVTPHPQCNVNSYAKCMFSAFFMCLVSIELYMLDGPAFK